MRRVDAYHNSATKISRTRVSHSSWFGQWSVTGRIFAFCGTLLMVIGLFFAEENWRGRKAWEDCRLNLERKGVELDWHKFTPPPVPDAQNFATTPFLAPLFDFNPTPLQPGQSCWRDAAGHD